MWKKEQMVEFHHGMKFTDITKDKILLIQMEHFRQMDYPITRGISYERTVQTFLAQLELSDMLCPVKQMKDICILLNEEGAILRYDDEWHLIFTPDKLERHTLAENAELIPVFEKIMEAVKQGKKRCIHIDSIDTAELMSDRCCLDILEKYCREYPGGYMAVAKKIVLTGPEELYSNVSVCSYGNLNSVDLSERESYDSIIELLSDYIKMTDSLPNTPVRPLSIAVFGSPGSGKSFGVKQLAKSLGRFDIFTLNLSQYNEVDELMYSLDNALNTAEDIPLIFIDEFDSDYKGLTLGWLKFLLAPMQDGEYSCQGKLKKVDKAVFVFAGGTASSFDDFVPTDIEKSEVFKMLKGPDFVSRLRGILDIKGLNPVSDTDNAYMIRRALLLREMLISKMPGIYNRETGVINISPSLLSGFIRTKEYKHGSRSMEFILDMSHMSGMIKYTPACLPVQKQMNIHVDYKDFCKRFACDRYGMDKIELFARKVYESECFRIVESAIKKGVSKEVLSCLEKEHPIWEWLEENRKIKYIELFRGLVEGTEEWSFPIGIRPCSDNKENTVTELYGEMLDEMAKLEFEIIINQMKHDGWRKSEYEDEKLKLNPWVCSYDELSKKSKEEVIVEARMIPKRLGEVGLELYIKK